MRTVLMKNNFSRITYSWGCNIWFCICKFSANLCWFSSTYELDGNKENFENDDVINGDNGKGGDSFDELQMAGKGVENDDGGDRKGVEVFDEVEDGIGNAPKHTNNQIRIRDLESSIIIIFFFNNSFFYCSFLTICRFWHTINKCVVDKCKIWILLHFQLDPP